MNMHYGGGMMTGMPTSMGWWMWGSVALVVLLVVVMGVVAITLLARVKRQSPHEGTSALRILEERFARGDITAEEFNQRRELLLAS